ncbi:MAG: WD40/YVTN/BNR-like repeat-containing protein [Candidatus Thorarchaeota archaeon]|jgi:photosystem II stability/assembly factor-like uncharacterized protein
MQNRSILAVSISVLLLILPFMIASMSIPSSSTIVTQDALSPWVRTNGPYGGLMNCIEIDPTNSDTLYAVGAGSDIFKSTNGGSNWSVVGTLPTATPQITDLIISQTNPQILYLQTVNNVDITGHLYRSTNGGVNWSRINYDPIHQDMSVMHFALHPTNDSILVAVMWNAFAFMTYDAGSTWVNVSGNLPRYEYTDIAISGDNEIWVGVGDPKKDDNGSLYHTVDGGVSWEKKNLNQAPETYINTIMVHPDDPSTVYVSLRNKPDEPVDSHTSYLSMTDNGGSTWQQLNTTTTLRLLAIVPSLDNDTIYASYGPIVYTTDNYGLHWDDITIYTNTSTTMTNDINDLEVDPTNSDTIYIPRRTYGIYKSTDGGENWTTLTDGLNNTNACLVIASLVEGSDTVYVSAVEGTGTFRTDDAGESWHYLDDGGIWHPFTDEIQISPHDPNTVWQIADIGTIFITNDSGVTWDSKYHPQHGYDFRFSSVTTIESAPSDNDILYAVKAGWGLFGSEDGGYTWDFLAPSEVDYSYTLAVDPTNASIVYSGYNPKPFQDWAMVRKSEDSGISWETVLNVTGSGGITSLAIDPNNPNTLYAGSISETGGEVYKTMDAGLNWEKLNDNFTMCTVMAQPQLIVDPTNPGIAYIGTWLGGTWKTVNAGATWTLLENAPISATAIQFDKQDSNILYLADRSTPSLWKSVDAGATWFDIVNFQANGSFLVNNVYADGDVIYCATFGPPTIGGDLYRSIDGGVTWSKITGILPRSVLDIAVDPVSPEIVYVTTHVKQAYKSINSGDTWTELVNYPDVGGFDIEIDPSNTSILYSCGFGNTSIPDWVDPQSFSFTDNPGVYKSDDSGQTWYNILNTTDKARAMRMYPGNSSILFAVAHGDGIYLSVDAGETWVTYNSGLDTLGLTSIDIQGDTIYVGTQGYGVYSGDFNPSGNSITWSKTRSNKPIPQVYSMQIVVDPEDSDRIYVSSFPGGLYRSDDAGVTFYDKNFQTPSIIPHDPFREGYYTFALNPDNTSEIWLGTWGGGMFKSYDLMDHNVRADGSGMTMLGKHIYQLEVSPLPPHTVYAATEEGVYISEDYGATWLNFSTGLHSLQVRSIELTSNGRLYCGTMGYGMYIYDTTESKWIQLPPFGGLGNVWPIWNDRPTYQYSSLLFHPTNPDIVYIGCFPAGIFMSTDGGTTWFESNAGWLNDGVFTLVNHPLDPEVIYAGTYNGVSRSFDGGLTWHRLDTGWPAEQWAFSIVFNWQDPEIVYACSKNGENEGVGRPDFHGTVMKSVDGGESWFEITNGLNITQEFFKIIVDKHNPDTIYLASEQEGVFISYDGGAFWEPWIDGLTNLRAGSSGNNIANPMALSADGRYLYFGTFGSGVFRRTVYIPPVTTTTTPTTPTSPTSPTTTTTTPIPPNGVPTQIPIELIALLAGGPAVIVLVYLVIRRRNQ